MKKYIIPVAILTFLLISLTGCQEPVKISAVLQEGTYSLKPLDQYTPYVVNQYFRGQEVRINSAIGKNFSILKSLEITNPYYVSIKLGNVNKEYLMLMDLQSDEKSLYLDTDSDGDIANTETRYILYRQKYGAGVVYSTSQPITVNVSYTKGSAKEIHEVSLVPYVALNLQTGKGIFMVMNRNWLAGEVVIDGEKVLFAIVDYNCNGSYNDDADYVYFDLNQDGVFNSSERTPLKNLKTIIDGKDNKYQVMLADPFPATVQIVRLKS